MPGVWRRPPRSLTIVGFSELDRGGGHGNQPATSCLVAGEPGCFLSIQIAAEFGFGQRKIPGPSKLPAGTSMKKPKQSGPAPWSSNRAKFGRGVNRVGIEMFDPSVSAGRQDSKPLASSERTGRRTGFRSRPGFSTIPRPTAARKDISCSWFGRGETPDRILWTQVGFIEIWPPRVADVEFLGYWALPDRTTPPRWRCSSAQQPPEQSVQQHSVSGSYPGEFDAHALAGDNVTDNPGCLNAPSGYFKGQPKLRTHGR